MCSLASTLLPGKATPTRSGHVLPKSALLQRKKPGYDKHNTIRHMQLLCLTTLGWLCVVMATQRAKRVTEGVTNMLVGMQSKSLPNDNVRYLKRRHMFLMS